MMNEISAVLKKVEPNAHKIVEHRRKYDRLRKEREAKKAERDRLRRRAEAQAAYEKAKRNGQSSSHSSGGACSTGFPGGMPGGFPGGLGGGMPAGVGGGFPGGGMPVGMPSGFLAKRLLCSTAPADHVYKVFKDDDITSSSPEMATPLDDDNLLEEIILRLPLHPSSLPRASLVCKRWLCVLSSEKFTQCYRKHHRNHPPLLGFFAGYTEMRLNFVPVLDTEPNSIPISPQRFAVPKSSRPSDFWSFFGCRHGLAVLLNELLREVVVWDPLTGQQHRVSFPRDLRTVDFDEDGEFMLWQWHTAVLCADAEEGHVHGDCFSSPFKLVLICSGESQSFACLYESASGVWGEVVSTLIRSLVLMTRSSILTGNAFYWLFEGGDILVFDSERQTLGVIKKPADAHHVNEWSFLLLRTDNDSGLGLAVMLKSSIQLWERRSNSDGVVEWVLLQKTFQLEKLFPQGMHSSLQAAFQVGYDEDSNAIVLVTRIGDFMLELDSMRFKTISKSRNSWDIKIHHPYRNFFTAGRGVGWKRVVLDL